jgi:hypothetical protein
LGNIVSRRLDPQNNNTSYLQRKKQFFKHDRMSVCWTSEQRAKGFSGHVIQAPELFEKYVPFSQQLIKVANIAVVNKRTSQDASR